MWGWSIPACEVGTDRVHLRPVSVKEPREMGWGCEWQEMRPSGNWGCSYVRPVDQGKEGRSGAEN